MSNVGCRAPFTTQCAVCSLTPSFFHCIDDLHNNIAGLVIENRVGSEFPDEVVVLGTGGGVDSEAEGLG